MISSVSEREWKREHKLEFKMASNRFYIFLCSKCKWIFQRFALPLAAVRGLCERKYRWGHAEFLARRLEEWQRTLRVMYGRVTESAQDYCSRINLLLMQIMNSILQLLATLNSEFHYQGTTEDSSTMQNSQWSNWMNASHNIVQVSDQEEKLCCWPSGIPNSCLRRLSVLGDIPSILAISIQRNPDQWLSLIHGFALA